MSGVNIPDKAYEEGFLDDANEHASEREVRAIIDAAAPLIVAAELERLADGGWSPDRYTAGGQLIPRSVILARAAELRGGA